MAQKISDSMFFMKRVFPAIWFGMLLIFGTVGIFALLTSAGTGEFDPGTLMFAVLPVVMAVFGYNIMKQLIWNLVDEVYDHGDYLVVRNRGDETRIELADIMNVNASTMVNPPRITLRLRQPTKLGTEVSFSPVKSSRWRPFGSFRNEVAEDLIVRVDRARSKRDA